MTYVDDTFRHSSLSDQVLATKHSQYFRDKMLLSDPEFHENLSVTVTLYVQA